MSDEATVTKLAIIPTIKDGINIGSRNIGPILVNVLLYVLTCWIPYLNVGTTIGISVGIIGKASRNEPISMTEIFNPQYRKYMGEFFLTSGLLYVGILAGFVLMIIPGYVIALAWSLATLLVVDKGKNPIEAISLSNKITYGYKRRIFGVFFLTALAFVIVVAILLGIGGAVGGGFMTFMSFLSFLVILFAVFVFIGMQASIYKQLAEGV
jgi:hypothetical protein